MPLIRCLNVIRNGIQSWHSRRGMAGRAARRRFFQPLGCEPLESRRLLAMDFGDAPDTYGTLLGGVGGARHTVGSGLFLGATVDGEADANAPLDGTGDDVTGSDDEDGVTLNSNLVPGQPVSLTIVASATGFLDAWFDLSFDGTFTDQDEQFLNSVPVVAGANNFSQLIPSNTPFGTTFARFRISSAGGLFPTGPAPDGEVEDYPILIQTVNRFTVNNIGDTADAAPGNGVCADSIGNCTLRAAIQETNALANLAAGPDVILFDIPGSGPHTITPGSALPTITQAVVIDGTTEPDWSDANDQPVVELNGVSAGAGVSGLKITSGGTTIRGLAINRFSRDGVEIIGGSGNVIQQNFIGTDLTGAVDLGNARDGVSLTNSSSNNVGGTSGDGSGPAGVGNVISGNENYGVRIANAASTGNLVQGNYIGTNAAGTGALGNSLSGVLVSNAPSNTIGGTASGARNVISGNAQRGVYLSGAGSTGNLVQGNRIGTSFTGVADLGNTLSGVFVSSAGGNTIGSTTTAARNVISGNNRYGVEILNSSSTGNVVQGNYIGTNAAGTGVLGNSLSGVLVFNAPSNTIGGIVTGARNIISGNTQRGVYLSGAGATGNLVQGNRIGTNAAGTADLGNSLSGVEIGSGASSNTIGGTTVAARNIISGNNQHGVYLLGSGTTGNMVRGNYVGTTVNGTTALGNMLAGVRLVGVSSNSIGGTASGAGNRIGFNGQNGVRVTGLGTANLILRNSIFTNTGLGIDLNGDGVTANDTNDSDTGPNKLQNFPVMTSVVLSGANLNITYSIPSITPNSTYPIRVEFFIADADNQEGKTFLSSHSYTSPGVKVATIPAGSAVLGTKIVATATDTNGAGSTSEFSANRTVASSLLAAGGAAPAGTGAASLTSAQQRPVVDSAISRLIAQGLTATQVNQLSSVTVDIADLPGAGGTEIHVGLNGNDPLSGGPGNEFLVVGRGQGVLNGKGNQNRLPPGVTHFAAVDDNTAFLQSISATQSGAGPFAARRAVLTPDLVPRSTVLNAGNAAPLTSHADLILDRLFAALADGVIKDAGDLLTLF